MPRDIDIRHIDFGNQQFFFPFENRSNFELLLMVLRIEGSEELRQIAESSDQAENQGRQQHERHAATSIYTDHRLSPAIQKR